MNAGELQKHIIATYISLRVGMGVIAIAFPFVLWFGGILITHTELQHSVSAYHHTPLRNVFVGVLVAIGAFVYLYKGFSKVENYVLNFAGVFAVGVVMFPTTFYVKYCDTTCIKCKEIACLPFTNQLVHVTCAVLFFLCIAYVCIFRAEDTLKLITDTARKARYRNTYRALGSAMIALPILAVVFSFVAHAFDYAVFALEFAAIEVFGIFWIVKSFEMQETQADKRAAVATL